MRLLPRIITSSKLLHKSARKKGRESQHLKASKVSANFENYLRAAPLLKGEVGDAFVSELNDRIYGLGYMPNDPRYQGMTPAQKWKAVSADRAAADAQQAAEHAKWVAEGRALVNETMEKCRASFSDECNDMIQLWLCVSGKHCTEGATDWLEEYVEEVVERSYPRDSGYSYCVDSSKQCID